MPQSLRMRATRSFVASAVLGAVAVAAGCVERAADTTDDGAVTPARTAPPRADGGSTTTSDGGTTTAADAGVVDSGEPDTDACADGGCAPPSGCVAHPDAAFCDDFDDPDALTPGKTKWDFLEPTEQPVLSLSTTRAVSAPNALLSQVIDQDTPGAKFAKTITRADFTEVTWSYDVYLESIGTSDGFFLDDFQFTDAAGRDTFGFRIVMFADAGAIQKIGVEHNQQANGGPYIIEAPLPEGTVQLGKWHHFEQRAKFTFADGDGGDAGADKVEYTLWVDGAGTPVWNKEYPGALRRQINLARFAGMPLVFNKANSAGLKIHWDNHVVEMK